MADKAVLDASALLRATVDPVDAGAVEWLKRVHERRLRAAAPEHVCAEVAHTLRRYVRAGQLTQDESVSVLAYVLSLPLRLRTLRPLAQPALGLALTSTISVYDAFYVVLARALDATLVTADRRLAEHHDRVALLA